METGFLPVLTKYSLQLYNPLFHFRCKFKTNRIQDRGLISQYTQASKYVLQNFSPSMDVLNLTQYEIFLKIIPTTISAKKLPQKVPLH
jgi:hypothetical protein